ncbi:conserved hypothetical protein [Culex quinquefasciatus]|uniref:Uncharacterized protein n=1 Tax=Culex quinquefasciatus TaxID=7176 RepID=B0W1N8_CULQU|nr:conserved hypothetical protein [Culex quinquefasciatus]|eukprot:XP_001842622.1 conserved hypothetical protein [Culex quinquefasciatus]
MEKLDSKTLINWRDREIRIHIHVYSSSVSCKSLWEKFEWLISDVVVNEGYAVDLELLEEEVDQMIAMGQRVKARIAAMRGKYAINSSLVSTIAEAMRPEESELSQSLSSQVTDHLDHEHTLSELSSIPSSPKKQRNDALGRRTNSP